MARGLGAAMDGVVLGGGDGLEVLGVVALQALDELDGHSAGEERVFAVGFHAASPARVAKEIDVGGPEGETLIDVALAEADEFVVLGAGFIGDGGGYAEDKVAVPSGGESDGLGKHRGATGAGDAVEALVPPVVGGDIETRDGGRIVHELGDFLR